MIPHAEQHARRLDVAKLVQGGEAFTAPLGFDAPTRPLQEQFDGGGRSSKSGQLQSG